MSFCGSKGRGKARRSDLRNACLIESRFSEEDVQHLKRR